MSARQEVPEDIEQRIRTFLVEILPEAHGVDVNAASPLLLLLDSLSLLQLIQYLEREFCLQIGEMDVIADNFRSVGTLSTYIQRRLRGA